MGQTNIPTEDVQQQSDARQPSLVARLGLRLFGIWKSRLGSLKKAQSIYGTMLRIIRRKLFASENWESYDKNVG